MAERRPRFLGDSFWSCGNGTAVVVDFVDVGCALFLLGAGGGVVGADGKRRSGVLGVVGRPGRFLVDSKSCFGKGTASAVNSFVDFALVFLGAGGGVVGKVIIGCSGVLGVEGRRGGLLVGSLRSFGKGTGSASNSLDGALGFRGAGGGVVVEAIARGSGVFLVEERPGWPLRGSFSSLGKGTTVVDDAFEARPVRGFLGAGGGLVTEVGTACSGVLGVDGLRIRFLGDALGVLGNGGVALGNTTDASLPLRVEGLRRRFLGDVFGGFGNGGECGYFLVRITPVSKPSGISSLASKNGWSEEDVGSTSRGRRARGSPGALGRDPTVG